MNQPPPRPGLLARRVAALVLLGGLVASPFGSAGVGWAAEPPAAGAAPKPPANHLAKESSPYLLMHAHNPVDWYPWGEEALAKARREKKPIFLSIGYSSCYWCHVMERESFLNEEIAKVLNRHFVAIKVDREERPDIDEVYMRALQIYSQLAGAPQGGGWPLTMFLSPDGKPLVGGTYFPPRDRDGRTGLLSVLKRVNERWREDPAQWQKTADLLAQHVRDSLASRPPVLPVKLDAGWLDAVQHALAEQYDREYGGFGFVAGNPRRPKFPEPPNLEFLLDRSARGHDAEARGMLLFTLDKIAAGGIRDHLGGGFHRYSTDRYWRVPHFEKMLYDNAQLTSVYAAAYELDSRAEYQQCIDEMLGFIQRELTDPQGGFYSAVDAETAGQEGIFYAWQRSEIEGLLTPDEFALARDAFGLAGMPNFDQRYVLALARPAAELAKARGLRVAELSAKLRSVEDKLLAARDRRARPLTDTKVLAGWNGLMIRGYADAGRVLKNPQYLAAAARAADFLLSHLRSSEGRLLRSYRQGQAKVPAFLDDYAFSIAGLLALQRADGDHRWLDAADALQQDQLARFWDERGGGFYFTSADHEVLFARSKTAVDGVLPSGNTMSAANLIELGRTLEKPLYLERARQTIAAVAGQIKGSPLAAPQMAVAVAQLLEDDAKQDPPKNP